MSDEGLPTIEHKEPTVPARRFNSYLTWAIVLLVVFSLGLLTGYLWLYAPTRQLLNTTQTNLQAANQELDEVNATLDATEQELSDLKLKYQLAEQASVQNDLYISILQAQHDIALARLALTQQDTLTATTTVELLQKDIEPVYAALEMDTAAALKDQVASVRESLKSRQVNQAIEELRRLNDNLSLISTRILK
jgi:chromosome segregation ATPase